MPKPRIYRMLRRGEVRINGSRVKPSQRLRAGDSLRLPPLWLCLPDEPTPVSAGLARLLAESIRYEDEGMLVLDKPSRLAVHGGSQLRTSVIDALRQLRPEQPGLELAHRLDRDTSGCLMVAKKASTLRELHRLLRTGQIHKRYTALCAGHWATKRQVNAPLIKRHDRHGGHATHVADDGQPASTRFMPLWHGDDVTLLLAVPLTGRTHQIRVHAAAEGHPLLGDEKYASEESMRLSRSLGLQRLFLHAAALRVPREGGEPLWVECPLPDELERLLAMLQ